MKLNIRVLHGRLNIIGCVWSYSMLGARLLALLAGRPLHCSRIGYSYTLGYLLGAAPVPGLT